MDRRDTGLITKAYKYIRRWMGADRKWHYAYPSDQKRNNTRAGAKRAIAARTELITGIKPLEIHSEEDITDAIDEMIRLGGEEGFACPALGNRPVFVTKKTEEHTKTSKGYERTEENRNRKAKYIPFIPALLENGRLSEKSRSKKGVVYGVIGQVKYERNDGIEVRECVELAVAYDEEKRQFVLSFSDIPLTVKKKSKKNIKKALPSGRAFGNFEACPIVDAVTVPITIYSMTDSAKKVKQKNKKKWLWIDGSGKIWIKKSALEAFWQGMTEEPSKQKSESLFQKHIDALLKSIGDR